MAAGYHQHSAMQSLFNSAGHQSSTQTSNGYQQLDLSGPSTSSGLGSHHLYDSPLDCSKSALNGSSSSGEDQRSKAEPQPIVKRKKVSYAIEDLLKKDDS